MKKILAIDDNNDNLITIEAILKTQIPDLVVIKALSGEEGLTKAQAEDPDVILLDIIMPGMDGFETCLRLKEIPATQKIPVLMATAIKTDSESRVKALNLGADNFISKPIDPIELVAQVNVALRIKEAEDLLRMEKFNLEELVQERTAELKRLSIAVEQSPSAVAITDTDGRIQYINPSFTALTGYTLNEIKEKHLSILDSDNLSEPEFNQLWSNIKAGKIWRGEFHNKTKNETRYWEEASISPIFNDTGEITHYIKIANDSTQRKRMDQVQKILYNVAKITGSTKNLIDLLNTIREELSVLFDTSNFFVAFYDEVKDSLEFLYFRDLNDHFTSVPAKGTLSKKVIDSGKPLLVDGSECQNWIASGIMNAIGKIPEIWLGVPLFSGNKSTGVLVVQNYTNGNAFTREDADLLAFIAGQLSIFIENKKSEEETLITNRKLSNILDGTQAGTWEWNVQTGEVSINERWAGMLGYTLEELQPVSFRIWDRFGHPADLKRTNELLDQHFSGKSEFFESEIRMKHKNGRWIWIQDRGKVLQWTSDNKPLKMFGTQHDISGLKHTEEKLREAKHLAEASEQKYRSVLQTAMDGYWLVNKTGRFMEVNEAYCRMSGYAEEELLKMSIWEVDARENEDNVKNHIDNIILSGSDRFESIHKRKDGSFFNVEISVQCRDKNIMAVFLRDITLRKINETELIKAKEKAEESVRLKSAFLATMSHELRTPLNAVIGFSDVIKGATNDEDVQKFAGIINKRGFDLLELIEDIFSLAMVERSEIKIRAFNFQFDLLFAELQNQLKEIVSNADRATDLELIFSPDPTLSLRNISADRGKIIQVMTNLLKNAVKYTEKGKIELGCYEVEPRKIAIFVKDTGIGIPADKLDIIFEFFRQVDDSHTRKYGGTGIGLAISQKIAHAMNGEIKVESVYGKGSVFTFICPVENETINHPLSNFVNHTSTYTLKGKKILIAEDDPTSMYLAKQVLEFWKAEILDAENGLKAVEMVKKHHPDLVLMDIKMPVMNGYEAISELRRLGYKVPVVALSAYAYESDKKRALEAGCDEYLVKPLNRANLYSVIKKLI